MKVFQTARGTLLGILLAAALFFSGDALWRWWSTPTATEQLNDTLHRMQCEALLEHPTPENKKSSAFQKCLAAWSAKYAQPVQDRPAETEKQRARRAVQRRLDQVNAELGEILFKTLRGLEIDPAYHMPVAEMEHQADLMREQTELYDQIREFRR